ncbi:MAG: hypothetical protein M1838_000614 [Thelocarpon superellum]|nr:MAG: hypothetical protein M1838_000614 [Thelocarpon superellum]
MDEQLTLEPASTVGLGPDGMPVKTSDGVLTLSEGFEALASDLSRLRLEVLQRLAVQTRSKGRDSFSESQHVRLRTFLRALTGVRMTPALRTASKIDQGLKLVFGDPKFSFPEPYPNVAKTIYEGWEASNWGAVEGSGEEDAGSTAAAGPSAPARREDGLPAPDHPIYGTGGIMRGVLIRHRQRQTYYLDPAFADKIDAKVFGNNNLAVNAWWPRQICALRDGAHGARIGGIAGNADLGAYSIVVSSAYEGMDEDQGDWLIYSGSDSKTNKDPNVTFPSHATQYLTRSLQTHRPVRVLRSSLGNRQYSPTSGIRYDGLYTVTRDIHAFNAAGGLYLKFRLDRQPNQAAVDHSIPTRAQRDQESQVSEGY